MAAKKWIDCNVFQATSDRFQVWRFDLKGKQFVARGQSSHAANQPMPTSVVGSGWKSAVQPRLNVAWLPAESVFLRVIQLPQCTPEELVPMVELQMEHLSPLPLAQVVWNAHPLGDGEEGMQTVLVVVAVLAGVEAFLARLESAGLFVERLDFPAVDQLKALRPEEDGAWIMPDLTGVPGKALVGWWSGGVLRSLGLVELPEDEQAGSKLRDQLLQMAWAGEIEGWMQGVPRWNLMAGDDSLAAWQAALQSGGLGEVQVAPPTPVGQLALSCANRSRQAGSLVRGLLPADYATRYRQQFNDRLWMRGLGAAFVVYVLCVLVYFAAVGAERWRLAAVKKEVVALGSTYTNALDLKATYDVLNNLHQLRYAALDCLKATAELLPEDIVVDSLSFNDGNTLVYSGTAPENAVGKLRDFENDLLHYTVDGKSMFLPVEGKGLDHRTRPGKGERTWNFTVELRRSEVR